MYGETSKDKTDTALNSRTEKRLQEKQKKLIRLERTKVRRNVEKSCQTRFLQMQYSREKRCQHISVPRDRETLLDKTNSIRTCVTYGRTPNGQTELLQWDNKLWRNVNETTKIALTYG